MAVLYTVKRTGGFADAVVTEGGKEVAQIRPKGTGTFELESADGALWRLDPRVAGEIRPFSLVVTPASGTGTPVLRIQNHVFQHGGRFYMLMGIPEDRHPKDHLIGGRFIIRLDRFPFTNMEDIDRETWGRLRRLRGVSVGEIGGLGLDGHTVELSDELGPIGLQLAAASYLLYSTA